MCFHLKVVDRTLQLLEALSADGSGLGVTRLADMLGDAPSTVHRLLAVLTRHRMVIKDPESRRYRLGPGVLPLGEAYLRHNSLITVAQRYLDDLRSRTLESVFLTEYVNGDAICVATAESPRPLRFFMRVGQRMPYHAAASARAILAFRSSDEIERLLHREALERFTEMTPTTFQEALGELERVRQEKYAACDQEMEVGVTALSVPIRDATGDVIASLTIVAPQQRLSGEHREPAINLLHEQADGISRSLGYRPSSHFDSRRLGERPLITEESKAG